MIVLIPVVSLPPFLRRVPSSGLIGQNVMKKGFDNALFVVSSRLNALGISSVHAETNLIGRMQNSARYGTEYNRKKKKMYDIVVYRMSNDDYVMAKPCMSCATLIANCGFIKNVYYSTNNGDFENVHANKVIEGAVYLRSQKLNHNMLTVNMYSKRSNYLSAKTSVVA